MLTELLFGTYRQKALGLLLLHPEQTYHVREIARLTATSAGTLHKELARLAHAGLLTQQRVGNQVRYGANRQCPLFEELASIFRKTTGLTDVLRNALADLSPRIRLALIYGSVARGEERAGSDVDALLVGDLSFADVVKALHPCQEAIGREINPVVMSIEEFQRKARDGETFLNDILTREKIFLIGNDDELGKLAAHPQAA